MTNEEAIEELKRIDTDLLKTADCGNKTIERMTAGRGRKAMCLAIKALESQERMQRELKSLDGIADTCDKLDRALHMAVRDSDKTGTDVWCRDCPYDDDVRLEHCWECGVKYYKRKAGIEVADNEFLDLIEHDKPANNVNHPAYYTDGQIEVSDFIADKNLNFFRGNVVKYICRAGKKDPDKEVEDLQKARWYIDREIERLGGK